MGEAKRVRAFRCRTATCFPIPFSRRGRSVGPSLCCSWEDRHGRCGKIAIVLGHCWVRGGFIPIEQRIARKIKDDASEVVRIAEAKAESELRAREARDRLVRAAAARERQGERVVVLAPAESPLHAAFPDAERVVVVGGTESAPRPATVPRRSGAMLLAMLSAVALSVGPPDLMDSYPEAMRVPSKRKR